MTRVSNQPRRARRESSVAMRLATLATAATLSLTAVAAAEVPHPESPYAIGAGSAATGLIARATPAPDAWTQCRINGLGVLASALRGPLLVGGSRARHLLLDQPGGVDRTGIDRQSALVSVAAGVRTRFTSWLHGYAQLGIGASSRICPVPCGGSTISDDKVMPDGFFGVVDVTARRSSARRYARSVMGNFAYNRPLRWRTDGSRRPRRATCSPHRPISSSRRSFTCAARCDSRWPDQFT